MNRWIRQLFSATSSSPAFARFVDLLDQAPEGKSRLLRVLTYHRVAYPDQDTNLYPGLASASPKAFEAQMAYLAGRYRPVSILELLDVQAEKSELPERAVLVTFDDGYCDFGEYAWPVLRRYGIPVALFIPTAFPDHPERCFWWDRLHRVMIYSARNGFIATPLGKLPTQDEERRTRTYKQLRDYLKTLALSEADALVDEISQQVGAPASTNRVLGWEELKRLSREGVTIGAHTRTHPILDHLSREEIGAEVSGSFEDLQRELGPVLPIFAYPSGGFNQLVIDILKERGVQLAFTTVRGVNHMRLTNWLALKRINIGQATNLPVLQAQLSPLYAYFSRSVGDR